MLPAAPPPPPNLPRGAIHARGTRRNSRRPARTCSVGPRRRAEALRAQRLEADGRTTESRAEPSGAQSSAAQREESRAEPSGDLKSQSCLPVSPPPPSLSTAAAADTRAPQPDEPSRAPPKTRLRAGHLKLGACVCVCAGARLSSQLLFATDSLGLLLFRPPLLSRSPPSTVPLPGVGCSGRSTTWCWAK